MLHQNGYSKIVTWLKKNLLTYCLPFGRVVAFQPFGDLTLRGEKILRLDNLLVCKKNLSLSPTLYDHSFLGSNPWPWLQINKTCWIKHVLCMPSFYRQLRHTPCLSPRGCFGKAYTPFWGTLLRKPSEKPKHTDPGRWPLANIHWWSIMENCCMLQ